MCELRRVSCNLKYITTSKVSVFDMTYPTSGLTDGQNSAAKGIGPRTVRYMPLSRISVADYKSDALAITPHGLIYVLVEIISLDIKLIFLLITVPAEL
ncbi:hypothetical protein FPSE_09099 [Fusarium pseudograminearum CS3096]|uniref:Uncharacterized protein n=1 Tax=Fusarium pseudograminearum (strain CS3096) TaxID=1028729 RepID=K3VB39_FUSPC|nr:hypothetical protein FPSE_09099 [Fusarium pseudograminearum CS3096]EKJ70729.1 hypothetical protein FPSE_09099 [Fusarium pseudograminearum CS3096]